MSKGYERTLKEYAKQKTSELDWYVQRLITVANHDLYFGPVPDGFQEDDFTYPGFSKAIKMIKEALSDISAIYVNDDFECWDETKPDEEDIDLYYLVPRKDCIDAIVGKELAQYL